MSTTQHASDGRFPGGGIIASGLARSFGPVQAVASMDFSAPPGQVTALIGPNGSGKTTLLLMLASLLRPDAGTISVCGIDPVERPRDVRALLGWMPDTLGVWEALTAREILTTVGKLYGKDAAAARERADELLDLVKLGGYAHQPARVLSRGQQQRLSLARALVNDPAVLLLDEPASGLDPGARIDLRNLLRRFAAEGRTVVVSSHVLSELDEIADRAVFVSTGRTIREQSVDEAGAQSRRYGIQGLDARALMEALGKAGVRYGLPESQRRNGVTVQLASEAEAAALLRTLVSAGVAVTAFAPASGALEETYLSTMSSNGEAER
ncbi:ABC transporter ATP-binding protein [Zafaria sp. Z1313]|uniref:ABC transporter ATP-binding protein n=1 Tax=Zafaria sp. Z1313 TaxID=3423202 RepID=UPI003D3027D0